MVSSFYMEKTNLYKITIIQEKNELQNNSLNIVFDLLLKDIYEIEKKIRHNNN